MIHKKKLQYTHFTFEYGLMVMYKCEVRITWWTRIYLYSNKTMTNVHAGSFLVCSYVL